MKHINFHGQLPKTVVQATAALEEGADIANLDPARPCWHFRPPARWMNDPNGTLYYNGYYHLFYQTNPYDDSWGMIHWGHARSRDLVYWEHLPVALAPASELGEKHCYSGCVTVNAKGEPLLIYTSVGKRPPEQWAAIGDRELISWRRHEANPLLTINSHPHVHVTEWRDPFVFEHDGRTFMLIGGKLLKPSGENPVCLLYESVDAARVCWQYRSIFYRHPNTAYPHFECPSICKLDSLWVLFGSFDLRTVEFVIGDVDWPTLTFRPLRCGVLDCSGGTLYAPNIFHTPDGRTVLIAWVKGFKTETGWNGCHSLPRALSLNKDGRLVQTPIAELATLRVRSIELAPLRVEGLCRPLDIPVGDSLEIEIEADISTVEVFTLELKGIGKEEHLAAVTLSYGNGLLRLQNVEMKLPDAVATGLLSLRVFVDRALVEVFACGGTGSMSCIAYRKEYNNTIALCSVGGVVQVTKLTIWKIRSIW